MIGYVTKIIESDIEHRPEKIRGKKYPIEVESIFNYKGHNFIIHKPKFVDEVTGYVGTHADLGFYASNEMGDVEKTKNKVGVCKNPTQYKTPADVERAIKWNVDKFIEAGYSFDELVALRKKALHIVKPISYIDLMLKKIL